MITNDTLVEDTKLRVLHAPLVSLYQPWLMAKGLRHAGCHAEYMCWNFGAFSSFAHSCDYDLKISGTHGVRAEKTTELDFFLYALENYDIFHVHEAFGLLNNSYQLYDCGADLSFLKGLGKKIVVHWWGCDRLGPDMFRKLPHAICPVCTSLEHCSSKEKRDGILKMESLADLELATGIANNAFSEIKWLNNAIDTNLWRPMTLDEIPDRFRLPPSKGLRIYHSFGNEKIRGDTKGSEFIRKAADRLINEGYPCEFIFFDGVPNMDLRYYQAQADIVVDQLLYGWHGSTAVECMACGKPVVTYIRPEVQAIAPRGHPLINADIHTIYDVLKKLIVDDEYREEMGKRSRAYAVEQHDYRVIGLKLKELYLSLW